MENGIYKEEDVVDAVEAYLDLGPSDLVERLQPIGHWGHDTEVDSKGNVCCMTCLPIQQFIVKTKSNPQGTSFIYGGMVLGSINHDYAEDLCQRCDCPKTAHLFETQRCLMCGKDCGCRH